MEYLSTPKKTLRADPHAGYYGYYEGWGKEGVFTIGDQMAHDEQPTTDQG